MGHKCNVIHGLFVIRRSFGMFKNLLSVANSRVYKITNRLYRCSSLKHANTKKKERGTAIFKAHPGCPAELWRLLPSVLVHEGSESGPNWRLLASSNLTHFNLFLRRRGLYTGVVPTVIQIVFPHKHSRGQTGTMLELVKICPIVSDVHGRLKGRERGTRQTEELSAASGTISLPWA